MQKTAVKIAHLVKYKNAGTVEFLLTEDDEFYFMEMNTRIQVEHPVTEAVYGIDLIKCQLQVALNHVFILNQHQIVAEGHAIECRINAENPQENFKPCPGKINNMVVPGGYGVRVDSGFASGDKISPFYDSMVLKVICHGADRDEAIALSHNALNELEVDGICTNAEFAQSILSHNDFQTGNTNTKWIEKKAVQGTFFKEVCS